MTDCIKIFNMGFYAYHGTSKPEREMGQRFFLDAWLYCDLRKAADTDDVGETVDYEEVYKVIGDITCKRKYHLLEALSQDIAVGLLKRFPGLEKVDIAIRKPQVPLNGILDYVEVMVSRTRDEIAQN